MEIEGFLVAQPFLHSVSLEYLGGGLGTPKSDKDTVITECSNIECVDSVALSSFLLLCYLLIQSSRWCLPSPGSFHLSQ